MCGASRPVGMRRHFALRENLLFVPQMKSSRYAPQAPGFCCHVGAEAHVCVASAGFCFHVGAKAPALCRRCGSSHIVRRAPGSFSGNRQSRRRGGKGKASRRACGGDGDVGGRIFARPSIIVHFFHFCKAFFQTAAETFFRGGLFPRVSPPRGGDSVQPSPFFRVFREAFFGRRPIL